MDNHLHLVVHMDPILASEWPREEVARRWLELHPRREGEEPVAKGCVGPGVARPALARKPRKAA